MAKSRLPAGLTPRLLSKEAAAFYCGLSKLRFERTVETAVKPVDPGDGGQLLWDVRDLDDWVDQKSGRAHPQRSLAEWVGMLGDDGADQGC
jgi:hypothetical protein